MTIDRRMELLQGHASIATSVFADVSRKHCCLRVYSHRCGDLSLSVCEKVITGRIGF